MSHPDSDVVRRQELLLEARDGMAMELGDRWRIVQKPVNRSCQSPRCEIRSGDGNSLGRRLGPLAEDLSRSAVIEIAEEEPPAPAAEPEKPAAPVPSAPPAPPAADATVTALDTARKPSRP